MIPLLCILLGICWLFRKNKVNAVAAAEERRRSSIMKQKKFEAENLKIDEKAESKVNNIFNSEMQKGGQGADRVGGGAGEFLPGINDGKKGAFNDTLTGFMKGNKGVLNQVPNDEEINELMKGKSHDERKVLLKEIDKARQAKIHMQYLLE